MSKVRTTILAVAAVLLIGAIAEAQIADRIVAVVNDDIITFSEMNRAFEPYRERFIADYRGEDQKKALDEAKRAFLNRMIDNLLVEQEAKKKGITVHEDEIDEAIKEVRQQNKLSEEEFVAALAREGITPAEYRSNSRGHLMRLKLIGHQIRAKLVVTEEEIGEYYAKHREEYEGKESVRIRQILLTLPADATPEVRQQMRAEAETIHKELLAGRPFEELCTKFMQQPAAQDACDIGFIEKGTILPEVESVAFSLPTGEFSSVIESPVGFHIIQTTDRRGAGIKEIKLVRSEIKAKLENEKLQKKLEEWLVELRKKSNVEIRL